MTTPSQMTSEIAAYLAWLAEMLRWLDQVAQPQPAQQGWRSSVQPATEGLPYMCRLSLEASVPLATDRRVEIMRATGLRNSHYFDEDVHEDELKPEYGTYFALPGQAVIGIREIRIDSVPGYALDRAALAAESAQAQPQLILLGGPGAGKSIFLRQLAWAAAQQALDSQDEPRTPLPILLPLRTLAGALAHGGDGDRAVMAVLVAAIERSGVAGIGAALPPALASGAALLLFDGLDEVPVEAAPGQHASRLETLRAVAGFVERAGQPRALLTCRTRAFEQLRAEATWPVETLAPLTPAQVRSFIPACHRQLSAAGLISPAQAERATQLLSLGTTDPERAMQYLMLERARREQLFELASTPLLLACIALQPCGQGDLPRDLPQLYQALLELLLGGWDGQRALPHPAGLGQRILPMLDELAYEAYRAAVGEDERVQIDRELLHTRLGQLVVDDELADDPAGPAQRQIDWLKERGGVLVPSVAGDSYQFAYLALQHFCAARHMVLRDDPVVALLRHRHEQRWREPILLGAGLLSPATLRRLLGNLLSPEEQGHAKPAERWQRDLIMAAEIAEDRTWDRLHSWPELHAEEIQDALRHGLAALLADRNQPLATVERLRASILLGQLGDPRYPTTIAAWRQEIARALAGDGDGYFCRVEPGTYVIGSDEQDSDARPQERPQHRFELREPLLIARYPITYEQWRMWLRAAGEAESTYDAFACYNAPNQPVFGASWRRCNAFCAWLSQEIGATLRLPTEQEWEAAARGGGARRYPWGDEWCEEHSAAWTSAISWRSHWYWTTPVGCFPGGAAPCGALDMTGNVYQWTASVWQSYPGAAQPFADAGERVVRGGAYGGGRNAARCATRIKSFIGNDHSPWSFRVVLQAGGMVRHLSF